MPDNLNVIEDDIIELLKKNINDKSFKIAHQANCVTSTVAGLAKIIFESFDNSNIYDRRCNMLSADNSKIIFDIPGKIMLSGNNDSIINMFSQFLPGKPQTNNEYNYKYNNKVLIAIKQNIIDKDIFDTYTHRLQWFNDCLKEISNQVEKNTTIAFPYNIGCGLAEGIWDDYLNMIIVFAINNPNLNILIVQKK